MLVLEKEKKKIKQKIKIKNKQRKKKKEVEKKISKYGKPLECIRVKTFFQIKDHSYFWILKV